MRDLRPGAEVDDPRGGRLSASYVKPQSCCGQCLYTAMGVGSEVIVTSKDVRKVGMMCGMLPFALLPVQSLRSLPAFACSSGLSCC